MFYLALSGMDILEMYGLLEDIDIFGDWKLLFEGLHPSLEYDAISGLSSAVIDKKSDLLISI